MPDDPTPADVPLPDVLELVEWMASLAEGMEFTAVAALRDEVIAGRVTLTDREKNILATAGAIIHNAASGHAFRMFQKTIGEAVMGAIRVGRIPYGMPDDDEPEGGSKPS